MGDTYADLIERLGKATGPDRELDAEIAIAIFKTVRTDDDLIYAHRRDPGNDATHPGHYFIKSRSGAQVVGAALYTASVDAALTLIPTETAWSLTRHETGQFYAEVGQDWQYSGATPAIALCIAALRAKQSLSDGD